MITFAAELKNQMIMSTLKIKALEIYYEIKYFIPTLKDSIKKWIVSKVMKSEYVSLEKSHLQDPYSYIKNTGAYYNYALFFPVYAVHLCLFNVFKTNLIPLISVETNIHEINPKTDTLSFKFYTNKPSVFIGPRGETIDKINSELKKMFHCSNVIVDLREVKDIHTVAEY